MSTNSDIRSKRPTTDATALALTLARCVRHRREQLDLSIERAAELSGIVSSEWCALEAGWVPDNESKLLWSIAGALEAGYLNVFFIAEVTEISGMRDVIAKDLWDAQQSAHAQIIDLHTGKEAAAQIGALLLTASLSTAVNAVKVLTREEMVECLVSPCRTSRHRC